MKKVLALMLALGLVVFPAVGCAPKEEQNVPDTAVEQEEGSSFGDLHTFTAKTLDGGSFSAADFADYDVTVINIWSITCGPCVHEMPQLAELKESLPENINLITHCLDDEMYTEEMTRILEEAGFDGTTLLLGDGDLMDLDRQVMYIPTTVFVDSQGNLLGKEIVGSSPDIRPLYLEHINDALTQMGKDVIS